MNTGSLSRGDDLVRGGIVIEPGDILGDCAVKQLDILRQIADVTAEYFVLPLIECRTIEPDIAPQKRPDADNAARKRGFARSTRADNAEALPCGEFKGRIGDCRLARTGRGDINAFNGQLMNRGRQRHRLFAFIEMGEHFIEAGSRLTGRDEGFPVCNRQFDGG